MSDSKAPEGVERDSTGNEDHSIDWLEMLAGEPDAVWDQPGPPSAGKADSSPTDWAESTTKEPAEEYSPAEEHPPSGEAFPVMAAKGEEPEQLLPEVEAVAERISAGRVERNETVPKAPAGDLVQEPNGVLEAETDAKKQKETRVSSAGNSKGIDLTTMDQSGSIAVLESFDWEEETQGGLDFGNEMILEDDDLMWLDEMETVPEMNINAQDNEETQPIDPVGESASDPIAGQAKVNNAADEMVGDDSEEVPEDPDEAIAWLERLAARQGAASEELPTIEPDIIPQSELIAATDIDAALPEVDAGEIPEDPDEAMAWLERLSARREADENGMTSPSVVEEPADPMPGPPVEEVAAEPLDTILPDGLDEALGWLEEITVQREPSGDEPAEELEGIVSEEPPTPAVAHDVGRAMAEADLLFAEPEAVASIEPAEEPVDDSAPEDVDDAMAWLEQLAARQGAPIEELTTLAEEADDAGVPHEIAPEFVADTDLPSELEEPAALVETALEPEEDVLTGDVVMDHASMDEASIDETLTADDWADELVVEQETFPTVEEIEATEMAEVPAAEAAAEDLAWLDTLGAVDGESWLEAEAEVDELAAVPETVEMPEIEPLELPEEETVEPVRALAGILSDSPGLAELTEAREAMRDGAVDTGLAAYAHLIEKGEFLPFLIDDLEAAHDELGPEPQLQRVLGDAYARNGQLQKALQAYREALDNL